MSKKIDRTQQNPGGRGSKKRFATKSALKEPPQPMGWEASTIGQKGNTTPGNRQNKQQTSSKHKQALKNGQNHG